MALFEELLAQIQSQNTGVSGGGTSEAPVLLKPIQAAPIQSTRVGNVNKKINQLAGIGKTVNSTSSKKYGNSNEEKVESFAERYKKLRAEQQAKKQEREEEKAEREVNKDIAPSKLDFFQKNSLFNDGYDFGDISKTILGTAGDVGLGVLKGAGSIVEGLSDVAQYGVAGIADANGNEEFAARVRKAAQRNMIDEMSSGADAYLDKYSVLGRTSDALTQGLGQVGGLILGGAVAGAAGLGVAGTTALTTGVMGLSGMGSGMSEAYEGGADDKEAAIYGAISGASDALTELMFGGLGKAVKAVGLSKGLSSADDMLAKKISGMFTNQIAKNISEFGVKASAEGVEEIAAGVAQAIGKKMTYMSEKELADILEDENLLEQFVVGAATSGMIQSGYVPGMSEGSLKEANKAGRDFITGLDQNEQAVINKEIENRIAEMEADGKELSKKDKDKLYDAVLKDMEKGYISTDTIEEVLGGDEYSAYNALKAESEEYNTLYKTESGKLSEEQRDRLAELKEKNKANPYESELKTAKDNLSKGVFSLVEGSKLAESYNERGRRSEAYKADMSRYSEAQQKVIQKAVDSGVLNNTNRTHEFVDMVAKISADKGVLFDFTNNAKLKESGFAIDGKQINGFVTKDGITLNTDSAKYLNTVVGHEITHVLEGTEVYSELQNILFEYSKNKGDFDNRRSNLAELYKDVKDADIDAELTADLVGDYLFTDSDFINNLSTNNRNVFQKIYDEIKYLCKVVTAGSKEARELEKVKRAFEQAYKNSGKANADVKYSLTTDSNGRQLTAEQKEYFKESKVTDENGKLKVMYHGTPNGEFTVFRDGTYFTDNKAYADRYQNPGASSIKSGKEAKAPKTFEVYLDIKKPFDLNDAEARNIYINEYIKGGNALGINPYLSDAEYEKINTIDWTEGEDLRDFLIENNYDYDGLVLDEGADGGYGDEVNYRGKSYVVFSPEQVKNIDNSKPTSNPDIRYSISDSDGKQLTKEQQDYFKDSKARDENGNLKRVYHASPTAGFTVFDGSEGNGNYKYGEYGDSITFFTDNKAMAESYSPSNEKVDTTKLNSLDEAASWLESIGADYLEVRENNGVYELYDSDEAQAVREYDSEEDLLRELKRAVQEEYGDTHAGGKYEGYLNIKNPMVVDAQGRPWNRVTDEFSQELYDKYQALTAEEKAAMTDLASWEDSGLFRSEMQSARDKATDDFTKNLSSAYEKLKDADGYVDLTNLFDVAADNFSEEAIKQSATIKLSTNDIVERALQAGTYDGVIIKNVIDYGGHAHSTLSSPPGNDYIVFNSNQFKAADNVKPTEDADIRYSLGEQQQKYGDYNVSGKDIALEAPVKETVAENATVDYAPEQQEYFAPTSEEEAMADADERFASLSDEDIPPEMDAPYPGEDNPVTVDNPFEDRNIEDVGKRNVKAYMYENPEVKPFFQTEAEVMLADLRNSVKGERLYSDKLYYESGGEHGWTGVKRFTSDDIAYLLDSCGYTYAEIEKGLKAIIEDNGAENNACSKRIEFILNDRLMDGYTDFGTGYDVPANEDYIKLLNEKQINEYSKEAFEAFMANADAYAPPVAEENTATDIAPVKQAAPTLDEVKVKGKGNIRGQKVIAEVAATKEVATDGKTANIVANANRLPREKRSAGLMAATKLVDKGQVFENLSLETGNMELQAKYDYALPSKSEARAQFFMERGSKKDGVKSLDSIRKAVGKNEAEFDQYLYNLHNIDRMTLDERFGIENKAVYGDSVTAEDSRKMVAALEKAHPEFKQIANDVYKYNNHLRKLLVDNGVISQKTANLWQKMYPHYVPIHRVDDAGVSINVPLDSKKTGVNAPVKRATGGNSDFQTAFNTMAERTIQTYKAIAKNSFGVELKNTLGSTITQNTAALDEVIDSIDTHEELLKPGKQGMNPTFTVFENGERVEFEITEDMFDALKPADPFLSQTIKPLKAVSEIRRNMLTSWNPVFALYRNPVKDLQDVVINSQHPAKTYMNVPKAVIELASNGKYATEYFANGGKQNTYYDSDKNTFDQKNNVFKTITGIGALERAGEFIEAVPRLAEYIASREDGRTVERSMLDAARVTTNFAAGGDVTKFANRHGVTFLNASVQGAAQHVRNIREAKMNGLKGWVKLAAKYTAAGLPAMLLNSLLWEDDEEYEELSEYVKDSYYVIAKTEDGKFIRIPKGRTAAVIQDGLEQIGHTLTGDEEADWNNFFELFMNNIAPNNPIENNILAPIGQVMKNQTWYGEDLVPSRLADLPAEEQFDESTDAISKWLGEKTGWSPVKINYLLDQYSGGLGDMVLPMLTPEAESGAETLKDYAIAPWKKEITTDKVLNNKYPGEFYEMRDVLEINSNARDATEEDNLKFMYMDEVGWEMSALYAEKREIQNSDMPNSEKYEAIKEVQAEINALAEKALRGYNNVYHEGLYAEVGDKRFDYNSESGKWYEITPQNYDGSDNWYYQKEQEVTKGLGISYSDYWNNREEYNFAYDKPGRYAIAQAVGGYNSYMEHLEYLEYGYNYDKYLAADKDEKGESISGTRKTKVIDYINGLDLDYGEKLILYRTQYSSKADKKAYNMEIIDYLNSRDDIDYQEMKTILEELDMKVDTEGNITW